MFSLYKKDLQSYFYSPFAYVVCALFLLVFSLELSNGLSNITTPVYTFSFSNIFYNNFFYFIFLIPVLTMRSFAEERKTGTETLLMSSPITIPKIVIGKFLAIATVFLLMITLSFVYPLITALLGQVYLSSLICSYIGFTSMGLLCIAIGMLMSSFTDNPIIAAITGEGAMIVLIFLDKFSQSDLIQSVPFLKSIFSIFSTQTRFNMFSMGILRLDDLIFFITSIIVVLAWVIIVNARRRWNRG
ncbi:MAG: ABC transporter permease [Clostridiales bacterium]|jgi:ABC-2 type transport system permease protein|nr:ABC transporter permease [Clostridiales bacterium]